MLETLASLLEVLSYILVRWSLKALSLSLWLRRKRYGGPTWSEPRPIFDFLRVVVPALSKMTPFHPGLINSSDGGHATILQWLYQGGSLERHDVGHLSDTAKELERAERVIDRVRSSLQSIDAVARMCERCGMELDADHWKSILEAARYALSIIERGAIPSGSEPSH
jgi:hypothetical protein